MQLLGLDAQRATRRSGLGPGGRRVCGVGDVHAPGGEGDQAAAVAEAADLRRRKAERIQRAASQGARTISVERGVAEQRQLLCRTKIGKRVGIQDQAAARRRSGRTAQQQADLAAAESDAGSFHHGGRGKSRGKGAVQQHADARNLAARTEGHGGSSRSRSHSKTLGHGFLIAGDTQQRTRAAAGEAVAAEQKGVGPSGENT